MNFLLDTHTFIWSLLEPDKIPNRVRDIIEDGNNTILVSVVSFWEISIKYGLGKIQLKGIAPDELPAIAEKSKFTILALQPKDAASGHRLPSMEGHKDPFNRILLWQAIQNKATMISMDKDFQAYQREGLKLTW